MCIVPVAVIYGAQTTRRPTDRVPFGMENKKVNIRYWERIETLIVSEN